MHHLMVVMELLLHPVKEITEVQVLEQQPQDTAAAAAVVLVPLVELEQVLAAVMAVLEHLQQFQAAAKPMPVVVVALDILGLEMERVGLEVVAQEQMEQIMELLELQILVAVVVVVALVLMAVMAGRVLSLFATLTPTQRLHQQPAPQLSLFLAVTEFISGLPLAASRSEVRHGALCTT